jgi:hypothetical protein
VESGQWESCGLGWKRKGIMRSWFCIGRRASTSCTSRGVQTSSIMVLAGFGGMVPALDGSLHLRGEEPRSQRSKSDITMQVGMITGEGAHMASS